ncbi:contractile injection system protein, VgrG/Pvc8 family, partial [Staphylococcus aureus]|nr:contractile injection system protein, VgrG/Pvc8 family [Staphylococcus aureus]
GTTIGDMVRRMAGEHGLNAAVSASLASIVLPLTVQSQESDMNLLLRLAKQHDAIAKPGGGRLVFVKRGESTSASGERIPD